MVLDILAGDNIDFTRKIVKKNLVKTRENVLSKLNFETVCIFGYFEQAFV